MTTTTSGPFINVPAFAFLVASCLLVRPVAPQTAAQPWYCGEAPCIIPLRLSCEEMIAQYSFQGSCCAMESIPETRGCRVTVADRGNCYWYPYCGEPDPLDEEIGAGIEYTTDSELECPLSEFDPLFLNESSPDFIPAENRTDNVTCPPTLTPAVVDGSPTEAPLGSGGATAATVTMLVVASVIALFV